MSLKQGVFTLTIECYESEQFTIHCCLCISCEYTATVFCLHVLASIYDVCSRCTLCSLITVHPFNSHLRASMIWILGEYCDRIDNVDELLGSFVDNFHDENAQVQLQLLTSTVKLFLKRPADTQDLVQNVLSLATQDSDNPDLRDRGYIYWRLLSTDPAAAKDVVLAEKPTISEETDLLEPALLDELICHISTLASVYHKPPSAFVEGKVPVKRMTLQPRAEP